jgi:hypothetical protein
MLISALLVAAAAVLVAHLIAAVLDPAERGAD